MKKEKTEEIFVNYKEFIWEFHSVGRVVKKKKHFRYLHNELLKMIDKITPDVIILLNDDNIKLWTLNVCIRNSLLTGMNEELFKENIKTIYSTFLHSDPINYKVEWKEFSKSEVINNFLEDLSKAKQQKKLKM